VIDFAAFLTGDGKLQVARQIREACESTGFFYLVRHGVPQASIDAVFAASRRFFAQKPEQRMKVRLEVGPNRGYQPLGSRFYADKADAPDLNESFK
jgi:isopenicillin N synthase-like dioxygenase